MRIAVNTRLLIPNKMEGIGWFAYETLKRIVLSHPEVEFIFIFDRKPHRDFIFAENVVPVVAYPQARHPILWFLYFEFGVYRVLKKYKPDLFFSPDGWLSLRSKCNQLTVIHDLNFEHYPQFIPYHVRKYYHYFFPKFAHKATRIATVSEFTKSDIVRKYKVTPDNVDVVYNGVNQDFKQASEAEISEIRNKYADGKPYFLFVGLIHPRKNLKNQIAAFLRMKDQSTSDLKYIVVGEKYSWDKAIDKLLSESNHGKDVIFLGRQGREALIQLYAGAFALTYVSYFEGFGVPLVEAMRSGIPFITSRSSSMPEIAGNCGLLVKPDSIDEISSAMINLFEDPAARERMIACGVERAEKFTWSQAASGLWESMLKTLNS